MSETGIQFPKDTSQEALKQRHVATVEGPSNLALVTPNKTDAELAVEFRAKLRPLLDEVLGVLNTASKTGFQINFQFGRDVYGRHMVVSIDVVRPL